MWLVLVQLLIIAIIVIIKVILNYYEQKKIDKILNYFDKRAKENETEKQFKMCLEMLRQNRSKVERQRL